ncbi:putatice virulence related protein PagC [Candidatus Pantoea symbiotica]|jgi:putative virulence related protein PagC|uniref:Putatice virulence related protein PagC n=1 Tax=Candidatus Pantoea symbiotica TaxID=1884370 RepID=A0A1I3YLC5_9GAMM|nr:MULTISPECIES: Ail/Lom family outer membrane beta-barrel protein [Pantoea]SFK32159.1 putatice virulence related protein PagC [Pantoea symbiotica]SFU86040.1 putatice virulence related protein PagC [Pantoea sp. YR525]
MHSKILCAFLILASITSGAAIASPVDYNVNANRTTISMGYSQGELRDFGSLYGGNLTVQYEPDLPVGIMGSVTALRSDLDVITSGIRKHKGSSSTKPGNSAEYYSAMFGPTLRLNKSISIYALAGISHGKVDKASVANSISGKTSSTSSNTNRFAYGIGMTANVTDHLILSMGYEGSSVRFDEKSHPINTVMLSAGYRF